MLLIRLFRVLAFIALWLLHLPYWALWMRLYVQLLPPWSGPRALQRWIDIRRAWATRIYWLATRVLGARLRLEGQMPEPGCYVIVSNHQSSADIILLLGLFREYFCRFVTKKQLKWGIPTVSPSLRNTGDVFIRYGREADRRAIAEFARRLAGDGACGVIFPEGTRTRDGELRRFHPGGLHALCSKARLPIVPVVIDGLWQARDLWSYLNLPGTEVRAWVGAPLAYRDYAADPEQFVVELRQQMSEVLHGLRGDTRQSEEQGSAARASVVGPVGRRRA